MAIFRCNIANGMVRGMRFANGFYATDNLEEIKFLREFGGYDGCIIAEVEDDIAPPQTADDDKEADEDTDITKNAKKPAKGKKG